MNDTTAFELIKIHLLLIAGAAAGLEIGYLPNTYLFGIGMFFVIQALFISLLSTIETNHEPSPIFKNLSIYFTITGIYNLSVAIALPLATQGPQNIVDLFVLWISPLLGWIMIVSMHKSLYFFTKERFTELFDRSGEARFMKFMEFSLLFCAVVFSMVMIGLIHIMAIN